MHDERGLMADIEAGPTAASGRHRRRRGLRPRAWLSLTLGLAVIAGIANVTVRLPPRLAQPARAQGSTASLHFPLLLAVGTWPSPEAVASPAATEVPTHTVEPSPTRTATSIGSPRPTATPFPTPFGERVVFQSTDNGELPRPPYFRINIREAPWITIYADGTYIRAVDAFRHDLVTGHLSSDALEAVLDRLEFEGGFFDYPSHDTSGACATDGSTTYAMLHRRGRAHRIQSYMMLSVALFHPDFCVPGNGLPIGPETDRFLALAGVLETLNTPLDADESTYRVEHATVYADPRVDHLADPVPWPLSVPISETVGTDTLSPEGYATLIAAIQAQRESRWDEFAVFRDAHGSAAVGVRVEVPDWQSSGP